MTESNEFYLPFLQFVVLFSHFVFNLPWLLVCVGVGGLFVFGCILLRFLFRIVDNRALFNLLLPNIFTYQVREVGRVKEREAKEKRVMLTLTVLQYSDSWVGGS